MIPYITSEQYNNQTEIIKGEYEDCIFTNCDFSDQNLNSYVFCDCEFKNCNLSNVKLNDTAFRDVKFINCKLMGNQFTDCNPFSISFTFDGCILDFSSFYQLKIKKTVFKNCRLLQSDFARADLSNSRFIECDLSGSVFENTNLAKSDFSTSFNLTIDPESNTIKNAVFSKQNIVGLLAKYNIKIVD